MPFHIFCLQATGISMKEYEVLKKHEQKLQPYLVSASSTTVKIPQGRIFSVCIVTQVYDQENIVEANYFLKHSATQAYRSYILAYNSHSLKDIFDLHQLDLKVHACKDLSFSFLCIWFLPVRKQLAWYNRLCIIPREPRRK